MSKLSVVIITLNEEENIGRCIDSVNGIADEIVVVDSLSKDRTKEIALSKNAKVIERAFTNYIDQKNFALTQASNDYVMNLDADECLSEGLQKNIRDTQEAGFTSDAYSMNRLNFYCGQPIKTCGWYPDKKIRLWNKTKGKWAGELVHEKLVMSAGSTVTHLKGDILHYSFPTHESLIKQSERFAELSAQQLKNQPLIFLLFKLSFSSRFKFIRNYIFNLGFIDGAAGLEICLCQSREVFIKYFRAIQLKRNPGK
jgi:glycosyltransferase involved in cell wall biosynthesis